MPVLSPDIPQFQLMRRLAPGLPELAEAMLAEGVLRETDWTGKLHESLTAGVLRWTDSVLCGQPLQRVSLGLTWVNRLEDGMTPELWLQAAPGRKTEEPICFLGLFGPEPHLDELGRATHSGESDVFVRRRVRELEAFRPGLGFQVLGLLQDVAGEVLNAGGPGYAWSHLQGLARIRKQWKETAGERGTDALFAVAARESGLTLPGHQVTLERFLEVVPEAACLVREKKPRTDLIQPALRGGAPQELRPILEAALELEGVRKLTPETLRCDTPLFLDCRFSPLSTRGGALRFFPFAVRWAPEDGIAEIMADYHRIMDDRDSGTNILWMRAWQPSDSAGLRRAVADWKRVVRVALKAARLAELMHSEETPTP